MVANGGKAHKAQGSGVLGGGAQELVKKVGGDSDALGVARAGTRRALVEGDGLGPPKLRARPRSRTCGGGISWPHAAAISAAAVEHARKVATLMGGLDGLMGESRFCTRLQRRSQRQRRRPNTEVAGRGQWGEDPWAR